MSGLLALRLVLSGSEVVRYVGLTVAAGATCGAILGFITGRGARRG